MLLPYTNTSCRTSLSKIGHRFLELAEAEFLHPRLCLNEWGVVTIASLLFVFASSFPFGVAVILVIWTLLVVAVNVAIGISNGVIVVSATPVRAFVM